MRATEVPGAIAVHALVTEAVRGAKGDLGAVVGALDQVRREYLRLVEGSAVPRGVRFHVILAIERPEDEPVRVRPDGRRV